MDLGLGGDDPEADSPMSVESVGCLYDTDKAYPGPPSSKEFPNINHILESAAKVELGRCLIISEYIFVFKKQKNRNL